MNTTAEWDDGKNWRKKKKKKVIQSLDSIEIFPSVHGTCYLQNIHMLILFFIIQVFNKRAIFVRCKTSKTVIFSIT